MPNWGTGLPAGILCIVGKSGGPAVAKAMRGVNHTWKEETELIFTTIRVGAHGPPPNSSLKSFQSLTHLDLGKCPLSDACLAGLPNLKKLVTLRLGYLRPGTPSSWPPQPVRNLTDASLGFLKGMCLTDLHLDNCRQLTGAGFFSLQGLHLTALSLRGCGYGYVKLGPSPVALAFLRGLPLTRLDLRMFFRLTDSRLDLLRAMPLTDLDLGGCCGLNCESLKILKGMPLRRLVLDRWGKRLDDEGCKHLREFPLTALDLAGSYITGEGLAQLRGMQLRSLDLSECYRLRIVNIVHLRGLPLERLNVFFGEDPYNFVFMEAMEMVGTVLPAECVVTEVNVTRTRFRV